jgi:hypothetical protein
VQVALLGFVHIHAVQDALMQVKFHNDQANLLYGSANGQDLGEQAIAWLALRRVVATARHFVEHSLNASHLTFDASQPGLRLLA